MNARKYLWWRMCHQGGGPRYETFERMLVQTVPCQAAALDLCNGRTAVLALRYMQFENALRLMAVMGAANLLACLDEASVTSPTHGRDLLRSRNPKLAHFGLESCALHPKFERGALRPSENPIGLPKNAQDILPLRLFQSGESA
jgi:hypothetical protein